MSADAPPTQETLGRIALVSLGCAKNLADSEALFGTLQAAGFEQADDIRTADLALVNTCGFIDPAKEESIETILNVSRFKEFGARAHGGGLPRRALLRGPPARHARGRQVAHLPRLRRDRRSRERAHGPAAGTSSFPRERVLLTPSAFAYLKISEGCDQKCTFCAIPGIRGRLVSRTIEENVEDARRIAEQGVGEI